MIKSLNLEIINICNLKCRMCDIRLNENKNMINIADIKNILNSKHIDKNLDITITWWEPLLYNWLENLFLEVTKLWFIINTLSTNWILYQKLENLLKFLKDSNIILPIIHISIDWDKIIHDTQRWINWSFKKSIETIIKLKKNIENIKIKIKYTITKNNINAIIFAYNLSKKLEVDINYKIIENDTNYTNNKKMPKLLNKEEKNNINILLRSIYWNENDYINNFSFYIQNEKLDFKCTTPKNNIFIMSNWEVFPCTKYSSIWNIKKSKIDDLLFNKTHNKIIKEICTNNCNKCFSLHWSYKTINKWNI